MFSATPCYAYCFSRNIIFFLWLFSLLERLNRLLQTMLVLLASSSWVCGDTTSRRFYPLASFSSLASSAWPTPRCPLHRCHLSRAPPRDQNLPADEKAFASVCGGSPSYADYYSFGSHCTDSRLVHRVDFAFHGEAGLQRFLSGALAHTDQTWSLKECVVSDFDAASSNDAPIDGLYLCLSIDLLDQDTHRLLTAAPTCCFFSCFKHCWCWGTELVWQLSHFTDAHGRQAPASSPQSGSSWVRWSTSACQCCLWA